jgi:hypothetical protein
MEKHTFRGVSTAALLACRKSSVTPPQIQGLPPLLSLLWGNSSSLVRPVLQKTGIVSPSQSHSLVTQDSDGHFAEVSFL